MLPQTSENVQAIATQFTDKRWRLNNLYCIIDKTGEIVPFRMNWAQEALFDNHHDLDVILKARQLGFSTFIQLYMLDECVFLPNVRTGVIAHNLEDAQAIFKDKVKFPYDKLPEGLKQANPAVQDSARQLTFKNNSNIRVGTSLRSGTLQILHVSEFGKICARYPEKAKEIRTGAFNTVQAGQQIFVESTAEGQEGDFYDMCETAQESLRRQIKLTPLDFKFHFYPWWKHPEYVLNPDGVEITKESQDYFDKLQVKGIHLSDLQKAWYVKKAIQQGGDMKREYPSTPEEAFEAAIEGAYYGDLMAKAEADGRILDLPHTDGIMVNTWWDLGMGDLMTIWFWQQVGEYKHFIDYFQDSGEGLAHYAGILQKRQRERGFVYGDHVWPHDGNVRILDEKGRKRTEVMRDLGYDVSIVERGGIHEGIEAVRNMLSRCKWDKARCDSGIKAMKAYRKDWDDDKGTWKTSPRHDWASHAADAKRTGAMHSPVKRRDPNTKTYPQVAVV